MCTSRSTWWGWLRFSYSPASPWLTPVPWLTLAPWLPIYLYVEEGPLRNALCPARHSHHQNACYEVEVQAVRNI